MSEQAAIRKFNPQNLWAPADNKYHVINEKLINYPALELEIGAGVGMHPVLNATENSQRLIVALERTREKFQKFANTFVHQKLENLIPINADVVPWLWHFDHKILFDKIWILYPNPEPGNKNQRWINSPFFHHLLERLKPQGEIEMATNIEKYALEVRDVARTAWSLNCEVSEIHQVPRTHFEKKYLERGEKCYRILLSKTHKT